MGRAAEIAGIIDAVASDRLVTLTGPSGIGKTRLAVEVATRVHPRFPSGAWLVELAPVRRPELVPDAVASALGLDPEPGRDPADAVAARLGSGASLLVLDNCEHVLAACHLLVERLLAACPWLRVVATSQQPLGVPAERRIAVAPLSLLDPAPGSVEEALESEAVELFCVRAAAAEAGFRLTEEVLPAVAEICRRVDGIPLAIELAAARISVLGPADIAERLERRFRLLAGGTPAADPRHQTLQAALDWSYELLSTEEATLLRRLSVFAGGASLQAVEEVCGGKGVPRDDVIDLLTSLVAKSLVKADTTRPRARYRLLETTRAYGWSRLEEQGELAAVRLRHAAWCVSLVERAWHQVGAHNQRHWDEALEAENDNIRAALDWAVASRPDAALRLAAALVRFWKSRGYLREGQEWLAKALEACPDAPGPLRARALYGLALLATMRGDVDAARPAAEEGLALAREGRLRRAEAQALNLLGFISIFTQDPLAAKPVLEESVAKARADAEPGALAGSLALFGRAHLFLGDIPAARGVFEECLDVAQAVGDDPRSALVGLGWAALAAGELERSQELFERALAIVREARDRFETALALSFLGELAWLQGELAASETLLEEGRELASAMGAPFPLARCLSTLAKVVQCQGDRKSAAALSDQACRVTESARLPYAGVRALHVRGDLLRDVGDLARARSAYEEALAAARANADRVGAGASLRRLARLALLGGFDDEAALLGAEALTISAETGDAGFVDALELMAAVATTQRRTGAAAGLFGAAQASRDALGYRRPPDEFADYERDLDALRSVLDPEELEVAWANGGQLSRDEAAALALRSRRGGERETFGWGSLSATERQIVDLVADGLTNREVAERLFISPRTVQGYLSRIFAKLGLTSRRELRDARRQR